MTRFVFRAALLTYPRAFRRRFGAEMLRDFDEAAAAPPRHPRPRLQFIATVAMAGLAERRSAAVRAVFWRRHHPHIYMPAGRHHMFWDTLREDVQFALRLARRSPLFTFTAIAALALGIGANSAMFTAVHHMLLAPLPYQEPERLAMVWSSNLREGRDRNSISPANFVDYAEMNRSFESMEYALSFLVPLAIRDQGDAAIVQMLRVGPRLFDLLGREPLLGRVIHPDDRDVAVISHSLWRRAFGADPSVLGRTIVLSGNETVSIIGVMPPDFVFPYRTMLGPAGFGRALTADIWAPMPLEGPRMRTPEGLLVRDMHGLAAVGRLKPGVSVEAARADLRSVARQLEAQYPASNTGWSATVVPLLDQTVGTIKPALALLLTGVGVVLLMACINVASLTLARSVGRQRELAVRAALGASRLRLIRQSLTEGMLLAIAGAAASLLVVRWSVDALVAIAPVTLPRIAEVRPDLTVVAFTLVVGMLTGAIVGFLPALTTSRVDLTHALQHATRGAGRTSRAANRTRTTLVVVQVALAVTLTIGAALLLRSFASVTSVDPGFNPDHLLTLQVHVPDRHTTPDARRAFYGELFARLERIPGVMSVGGTTRVPLGSTNVTTMVTAEHSGSDPAAVHEVEFRRSMHNYFATMQMRVRRGRGFTEADGPGSAPAVVINETLARRVFAQQDPLGKRLRFGSDGPWLTVIGVVDDVRHGSLEEVPAPEMYVDYRSNPPVGPFIVIRTAADPAALAAIVRSEARALDPTLALYDITPMSELRATSLAERRFVLLLVGLFGGLALVIAVVGVYGVINLTVTERTPELGVRVALGASRGAVLSLVLRQAASLAIAGAGIGLTIALAVTPLLRSQLYGVEPRDPATLVTVPLLLIAIALVAAWIPARRAMRVDPVSALRYE